MLKIVQMFTKPKDLFIIKSTMRCAPSRYGSMCEYTQELYGNIVSIPIVPNYYSAEERMDTDISEPSGHTMYFFATNIRPRWFK